MSSPDAIPNDLPAGREAQLAWKWQLAKDIVDFVWLDFPETDIEAVLKAGSAAYNPEDEDPASIIEELECMKCGEGMPTSI
jgi:hypothetical protein